MCFSRPAPQRCSRRGSPGQAAARLHGAPRPCGHDARSRSVPMHGSGGKGILARCTKARPQSIVMGAEFVDLHSKKQVAHIRSMRLGLPSQLRANGTVLITQHVVSTLPTRLHTHPVARREPASARLSPRSPEMRIFAGRRDLTESTPVYRRRFRPPTSAGTRGAVAVGTNTRATRPRTRERERGRVVSSHPGAGWLPKGNIPVELMR